jgi:hypothetical protein
MKKTAKTYTGYHQELSENVNTKVSPRVWILVGALIAIFMAANIYEMRRQSCSSDEVVHLPAGYTYLVKRDFRLNPEHPPLLKELCALPLLFMQPKADFSDPNWLQPSAMSQSEFGFKFLYSNPPRADQFLFWGRLPIVLLSAWLGFFVFRWAQQLYGSTAGLLALSLYAFCPNVIAHSHFVTTDMGVTAFLTISFFNLWQFLQKGKMRRLCFSGLSMGAALASKYSALFLLPVGLFFLWGFFRPISPPSMESKKNSNKFPAMKMGNWQDRAGDFWRKLFRLNRSKLKVVMIFLGLALLVVQLSYLGSLNPSLYIRGAIQVNANHNPFYDYYMNGDFKAGGWGGYFLLAFLVKATAPFIILLFVRLIFLLTNWETDWRASMFLMVPSVVLFIAVSVFADCMGVRYVLPGFPLMMVFSSGSYNFLKKKTAFFCIWGLLSWHIISSIASFPYSLSYFNEFVGGPSKGIYWLDDSNVDWGQELKGVKRYMDANGIKIITLFSFSPFDNPNYYGINQTGLTTFNPNSPPSGIYVVSAHKLTRLKLKGFDMLSRYPVIGHLGYSMYIFKIS